MLAVLRLDYFYLLLVSFVIVFYIFIDIFLRTIHV